MSRSLSRSQIGVTEATVECFGETIFGLSHNLQRRRGDPVRLKDFDDVERQRADLGLSDAEISDRIGLSRDQVTFIRNLVERRKIRRNHYQRLLELDGGRRFRAERFTPPRGARGIRRRCHEPARSDAFRQRARRPLPGARLVVAGRHPVPVARARGLADAGRARDRRRRAEPDLRRADRGGVKYNPRDVEDLLAAHPQIDTAAIVPVPGPVLGERACCCITVAGDAAPTLEAIRAYLEEHGVAKVRWPERLEVVEAMPLTATRKVIKGRLTERLSEMPVPPT